MPAGPFRYALHPTERVPRCEPLVASATRLLASRFLPALEGALLVVVGLAGVFPFVAALSTAVSVPSGFPLRLRGGLAASEPVCHFANLPVLLRLLDERNVAPHRDYCKSFIYTKCA
jgi:hypothetical protein